MKDKKSLNRTIFLVAIPVLFVIFIMVFNRPISIQSEGLQNDRKDPITTQALTYYFEKVGSEVNPEDVEAKKRNFGCHMEIYIYHKGELDMRLSYSNGNIYEI